MGPPGKGKGDPAAVAAAAAAAADYAARMGVPLGGGAPGSAATGPGRQWPASGPRAASPPRRQGRAGAPGRAGGGKGGGGGKGWTTGPSVTAAKVFCSECGNWAWYHRLPKLNWTCGHCAAPGLGVNPAIGLAYSEAEAWALMERYRLADGLATPHVQGWGRRYDTGPARGRSAGRAAAPASGSGHPFAPNSAASPFA